MTQKPSVNPVPRMAPKSQMPYIDRDISWLSFNYRVLQEAKDPTVPLLERLKFLAIYSNNLDEFFRVRVANHRNLLRVGRKTRQQFEYEPKAVLKEILKIVDTQQEEFSHIFEDQILPELAKHNVVLKRRLQLNKEQREFVEVYFRENMLPFVQPVLLVKGKIRPFLNNAALYMVVNLKDKEDGRVHYAIVKIPSDHLPRFVQLPSGSDKRKELIMLDDIVRHNLSQMFPGYEIIDAYSIKLTRDAELYIDDEYSGDLLTKIKNSLNKRQVGPPSRFVYDREMPKELLDFLVESFDLDRDDLLVEGRYHNNFDFFNFPDFGLTHLKLQALPPLPFHELDDETDFFGALRKKDHLLYPPFYSYDPVVRFFAEAAKDPAVTHIKITQYRVAKKSQIMNALVDAVAAGKQVFVFIEVKARFDEEANLRWGEKLEAAGVKVAYSLPGVKVHAKMALIRREDDDGPRLYSYLSTGNFHEGTARVYCDFGLFTSDPRLTSEAGRLFTFLETGIKPMQPFKHLKIGQFNLRSALENLIHQEIKNHEEGKPAGITLKLNSIQDKKMISKLYEASRAGVPIRLIIRGICSLVPGKEGWSEKIEAVSIVDRYLEHARVFVFENGGTPKYFLSSADWMIRNLSFRVETIFPVYDPEAQHILRDILEIQWSDNIKSRVLEEHQLNRYRRNDTEIAVQSQIETYYYLKRREEMILRSREEGEKTSDSDQLSTGSSNG